MPIPQTSTYAIRAMYHLARHGSGGRMRATDLSEVSAISAPYLSKVMARLSRAGLVDGQRGHHGGFVLARPPEAITVHDILNAVEDRERADRSCLFGWKECKADDPCPLHPVYADLRATLRSWADGHTLADLVAGGRPPALPG